jgi:arylsulfatase A-like enzyme
MISPHSRKACLRLATAMVAVLFFIVTLSAQARPQSAGPQAGQPEFKGKIGLSYKDSQPWWPPQVQPPQGAPNIVFIVLDDTGFAQLGCYGSEIQTPNIDILAAEGLRFTDFHATPLCSPSRACFLTGRNHQSVGMACVAEAATGFPGYNAIIPKSAAMLPEILRQHGYSTFAVGKWHLTPADQETAAGPFDRRPLGQGFQRYYGFLGGETNQYYPDLTYDNHHVEAPGTPEQGYHVSVDLTDRAIQFVRDLQAVDPNRAFFLYLAYGACHAPHQAPREWIDRYKGKFDQGWDKVREEVLARQKHLGVVPANTELSPRPAWIKAWDSLSPDEKRLFARMQEVFAGFLSHTDDQIGRLISYLKEAGKLDNTLLILVSDNGASAEGGPVGSVNENCFFNYVPEDLKTNLAAMNDLGGPKYFNHYPEGWALAGDTPLKRYKRETFQGGISEPLIIHWPKGIKEKGGLRRQYGHAIDLMPTILEAVGLKAPAVVNGVKQKPIEGLSLYYTFNSPQAPTRKKVQYYEMLGMRAIWADGWKCLTDHQPESGGNFANDKWQLYHVADDFSECHDLAAQYPDKVKKMVKLWFAEAKKYNVLPLDDRMMSRVVESPRPAGAERTTFIYYPDTAPINEAAAVNTRNRSYTITAYADIGPNGAAGVLLSQGSVFGGFSFFIQNKKLVYVHNYVGVKEYAVTSSEDVPTGPSTLRFEFQVTGPPDILKGKGTPGIGRLYINGKKVGEGVIPVTVPVSYSLAGEGLAAGRDVAMPVTWRYRAPFKFTGTLKKVVVEVKNPKANPSSGAEMKGHLGTQ